MREIWLRTNRRAIAMAYVVPLLLLALGLPLVVLTSLGHVAFWFGMGVLALAALIALALTQLLRQPRLAYESGELLVYLGPGPAERVPIEHVECFFLGQAPSLLAAPQAATDGKALAIIVRIAERAREYHDRPSRPQLGQWREGYITIRGTWCEPIHRELLEQLNRRLAAAHRAARSAAEPNQ